VGVTVLAIVHAEKQKIKLKSLTKTKSTTELSLK